MENQGVKQELDKKTQDQKRIVCSCNNSGVCTLPLSKNLSTVQSLSKAVLYISPTLDQPHCGSATAAHSE